MHMLVNSASNRKHRHKIELIANSWTDTVSTVFSMMAVNEYLGFQSDSLKASIDALSFSGLFAGDVQEAAQLLASKEVRVNCLDEVREIEVIKTCSSSTNWFMFYKH